MQVLRQYFPPTTFTNIRTGKLYLRDGLNFTTENIRPVFTISCMFLHPIWHQNTHSVFVFLSFIISELLTNWINASELYARFHHEIKNVKAINDMNAAEVRPIVKPILSYYGCPNQSKLKATFQNLRIL